MKVKTLGIELAKETFGLHGVDAVGRVVVHQRITRRRLIGFLVKLEPCLVGMWRLTPSKKFNPGFLLKFGADQCEPLLSESFEGSNNASLPHAAVITHGN